MRVSDVGFDLDLTLDQHAASQRDKKDGRYHRIHIVFVRLKAGIERDAPGDNRDAFEVSGGIRSTLILCSRRIRGGLCRRNRSEEHTSELQSRQYLVCRLLLEKKKKK